MMMFQKEFLCMEQVHLYMKVTRHMHILGFGLQTSKWIKLTQRVIDFAVNYRNNKVKEKKGCLESHIHGLHASASHS